MKNIDDISEKVEKRKLQLQALFTKDEENYDLWVGKEQIFDTHKMSVNITGAEMTALALKVQASLTRSRLDIHVLPPRPLPNPNAEDTANQEERMYHHGFEMADERLSNIGDASLLASAAWQAVVLGRIAVRVLVYKDKETGKVVWDYLSMIPRFVTFSFDAKGLAWYRYETFRSPESIKSEYGMDVSEDMEGKGVSVSDYWDREHNVRYLTKDKTPLGKAWKHPFKEVPAIIQPVTLGPKAITNEGINVTAWGQSIFDPVKIPFRNLNKMRSIAATQAHLIAKAPLDVPYEGDKPNLEADHFDYYPGAVLEHPNTYTIGPLKIADIPASLMAMMGDLATGIQRVTGTELHPEWAGSSGTALRIAGQDKGDVRNPRTIAINSMYTRICRMVKRQIRSLKLTIPVRTVVNDQYEIYDMKPALLDNDFYVRAELITQDVYDEEATLQRAQLLMQLRLKSRRKVMEEEMKESDVPAAITEMDMEDVEAAIPEMKLRKLIKGLRRRLDDLQEQGIDDKDLEDQIKMMEEELAMLVIQKQQALVGTMGQPTEQSPGGVSRQPGVVPGVP